MVLTPAATPSTKVLPAVCAVVGRFSDPRAMPGWRWKVPAVTGWFLAVLAVGG